MMRPGPTFQTIDFLRQTTQVFFKLLKTSKLVNV